MSVFSKLGRRRPIQAALLMLGFVLLFLGAGPFEGNGDGQGVAAGHPLLPKAKVAEYFESYLNQWPPPESLTLMGQSPAPVRAQYTLEPELQNHVEKLFKSYRPDYGAFVALEADTGRIISLYSFDREKKEQWNLALRASFPAASIIKIVTAAAAIDSRRMTPETTLAFTGGNHTLYRRNVFQREPTRWARWVTLSDAFAKSINTFFAKVGLFVIEPKYLIDYSGRFYFNQSLPLDFPLQSSRFELSPDDPWSVAEVASGFNRSVTLSPVHGALLAAAVANDGVMMEPCLVSSLRNESGEELYRCEPKSLGVPLGAESAQALRKVMTATISQGTARQAFRSLFRRREAAFLEIGGKTGSLAGFSPKGKYDWFVGYARAGERKIAVAALTINERNWRVKSSFLARSFIEAYFTKARDVAIGTSLKVE